ncbi:hypothetical protein O181_094344 [Austropuccinia psidii MF-1]|uniref:Uncharacterized protein n=1 Tax=Austropuccinia psidii MF-1 TaxID=1389203 RepID=A0A9Q3PAR3_9BASI|nr:hypothetical protein [Austropuccinia psidii MF-1]
MKLIGKNEVEVKLTAEISRKHPVFPVSLVKPYIQTEEDKLPSRKKMPTPLEIVEVEDSPGHVNKIIKARKIRLNGKGKRQYLVIFIKLDSIYRQMVGRRCHTRWEHSLEEIQGL